MEADIQSNFFGNKRFLSLILSYLVGGWGIIQFVDWLVGRYAYAPVWTDICLLFFLLLLPGVLVFAWAQTSKRNTSTLEKVILPANALLALGFLVINYNGAQLGATLQKVTVTNEEGQAEERYVATSAVSKRIVFMPFQMGEGIGPEEEWLRFGLPALQDLDTEQDLRVQSYSPFSLDYHLQAYNYRVTDAIPLSVQRKVAEDLLSDFFVTAELSKQEGKYQLAYQAFLTNSGEEFFTGSYTGENYYSLLDQFSKAFNEQVFLQEISSKKQKVVDQPASDLLSPKPAAFKAYIQGMVASTLYNDQTASLGHFEEAIRIDPNFAYALLGAGRVRFGLGQPEAGKKDLEKAMALIDVLPEGQQFEVKSSYYLFTQDLQKAIRLLEMWRTLYPNNYSPYSQLFNLYYQTADWGKAKQVGKDALANGHRGGMLLNLARLSANLEEFDDAFRYFEMFKEAYPAKVGEATEIGDIYLKQGQFDKAGSFFEEMTLLNPNDYQGHLKLGEVAQKSGRFAEAEKNYQEALRQAKRPQDTIEVWRNWESLLDMQGKMSASQAAMLNRWQYMDRTYPPILSAREVFFPVMIYRFTSIGQDEKFFNLMDKKITFFNTPQMNLQCAALLNYYLVKEDAGQIRARMDECGREIEANAGPSTVTYVEGSLFKFTGDYVKSNELLNQFVKASGLVDPEVQGMILDNERLLGNLDEAAAGFDILLERNPYHAYVLEKSALLYYDQGKPERARELLQRLLMMWSEADPAFQPKQKIEKLLADRTQ